MAKPIPFYFDFSSPYGYIAAMRMDAFESRVGRPVVWRAIMIGPAMKETGNRPLLDQGIKGQYAERDLARLAREFAIPWRLPDPFPIAALAPSRAFWWLKDVEPGAVVPFAKAVYSAYFAEGRNITTPEVLADIATTLNVDADSLLAATKDPSLKDRLKRETAAAIKAGVFGSPFLIVDGEPFWGSDRLDMAAEWATTGGW